MTELPSWNDTGTTQAIVEFVETAARDLPPEERVAVFDNDGTLWSEKPMPIELGFILQRLATMAEEDASLREKQPWKAAYEKDYAWLGGVIEKHYTGDDSDVKVLMGGILRAFADQTVDEYASAVVTDEIYAIPPERVVGSSSGLRYTDDEHGGSLAYLAEPDIFDDGPAKPVRIWSRVGRRPILAGGNSNGDIPMLRFAGGKGRPALRLLVLHDDAEREFDYVKGAEQALERAKAEVWTVVSVKDDWATVFADDRQVIHRTASELSRS
jgi:hypothetical protein